MSFKQCSALRPDGERCKRVARDGSEYCHAHRNHKARPPLLAGNRLEEHLFDCADCGHLIPRGEQQFIADDPEHPGEAQILCEPCHRLRLQIEARIAEICAVPAGLPKEKIYADLERFGVDQDFAEAARLRMHSDGRLVSA